MASLLTKNDYAYAELRERILTGSLPAGEAIPQARIATELGLSTTPLREAIRRLSSEGLVELTAHRDARVTPLSAGEAQSLYEVRESVDPLAARLAAERRTPEDAGRIEAALVRLIPLTTDMDSLLRHRQFHRAIYRASANPLLVDVLERLWDKADRYRILGLRAQADGADDAARVQGEHEAIADAVLTGSPEAAEQAMRGHIEGSLGRRAIATLEAGEHER